MGEKSLGRCLATIVVLMIFFYPYQAVQDTAAKIYYSGPETKIIIVDDDGDGDYTSIQQAIDNATLGDTILVYSGIYRESIVLDKQLILKGVEEDAEGIPVIDAEGRDYGVLIKADGCIFQNFKVVNTSMEDLTCAGIVVYSDNNVLKNNIISNNFNGMWLENSNGNIISSNNISDTTGGIFLLESSNNTVENNQINSTWTKKPNESPLRPYGVTLWYNCKNNTISNNLIACDFAGDGICLMKSTNNKVIYNRIYGYTTSPEADHSTIFSRHGAFGIIIQTDSHSNKLIGNYISGYIYGVKLLESNKNLISRNTIMRNGLTGLYLERSNLNTITKNNFINNSYAVEDVLAVMRDGLLKKMVSKLLGQHASFVNSFLNRWTRNYWDDWSGFGPKVIMGGLARKQASVIVIGGKKHALPWIPILNFDWWPSKKPLEN